MIRPALFGALLLATAAGLGAQDYDFLPEASEQAPSVSLEVETAGEFTGGQVRNDNPFNPDNVLNLKEWDWRLYQTAELSVNPHPWITLEGTLLGQRKESEDSWDLSRYGLWLRDPGAGWELSAGKLKREVSPGQVFKPGNLQDRLSPDNLLQGGASLSGEWGEIYFGVLPSDAWAVDFFNPSQDFQQDFWRIFAEGRFTIGGMDLTPSAAWNRDWWTSLSAQSSLGDEVILYAEGVLRSDSWVRLAHPQGLEFQLREGPGVQTLGGLAWTPQGASGTFYVEGLWNSQGLTTKDWEAYEVLSGNLAELPEPFKPLTLSVYADHMTKFRFLEASRWYGAVHWEGPREAVPGLEGGATVLWSAPRDIMVRGYASWITDPGFFFKGEFRVIPWGTYEFATLPHFLTGWLQAGWKLSF